MLCRQFARFNANGTRDGSFNPGAGANAVVWALALQPDGKILAAGDFTTFDESPHGRIVRLNPDGSLDSSFKPGTGANAAILALCVQTNGKLLLGGNFTILNGAQRHRIARLLPDGSLDPAFDPGDGPQGGLRALAVQRDGKILIGGTFTSVQSVLRSYVARLNADGSLDQTFDPGEGAAGGGLWRASLQSDGKVLVAGVFQSFNGIDCGRIARLHGGSVRPSK